MAIVYEKNASETVRFAAGELTFYLRRMLGESELPTINLKVLLGKEGETDQFWVNVGPSGGELSASNDRSVLLGVYDYLRRLGCRFLAPGRRCEVVPSIQKEQMYAEYGKRTSFRHRGVCIEGADSLENILDFVDWLPKVGYNAFFLQFKLPYAFLARWYHHEKNPYRSPEPYTPSDAARDLELLEREIKLRGLFLHQVGHGWTGETLGYDTLNWKQVRRPIADKRRPMAAQLGGVRDLYQGIPANTNLCYHRDEAVDTFAELVTDYAKHHPAADYLHIWLADDYNNACECPDCQKTTLSDQYVALLNEIDRRLTLEGLDTKLVFLLYQELLWPPVRARLRHPERFVLMFAPISRTFERSYQVEDNLPEIPEYVRNHITLPTDLSENLAFLRGWQEQFQGDSFLYDYPLGRAHYGDLGYVHMARVISQDIKQLNRLGLNGYMSCQELRACLPNALPNYVMGLTLFDQSTDVEQLIEEYFSAAYGQDWRRVLNYLEELSRLSSCDYLNGKGPRTSPEMAQRLERLCRQCGAFLPTQGETGLFWKLLRYHSRYAERLSGAMLALARGERELAHDLWLELQRFLCAHEPEYQPYLDVYRVMEVTEKYTGFGEIEKA